MVDFVNMDVCYANQSTVSTQPMWPAVVEHVLSKDVTQPAVKPVAVPQADADTIHSAKDLSGALSMVKGGLKFATFPLNLEKDVADEFHQTKVKVSAQLEHVSDTAFEAMSILNLVTTPSKYLSWAVQKLYEMFEPTVMKELIQEGTYYSLTRMSFQHPEQVNSYAWWHFDPFRATRVMLVLKGEGPQFCELADDKVAFSEAMNSVFAAQSAVAGGFVEYGLGIIKPEKLTDTQRHEATELTRNLCDPAQGHKFYTVKEGQGVVFKAGHALHRAPLDFKGERILSSVEVLN